jgi:hypothetical protein
MTVSKNYIIYYIINLQKKNRPGKRSPGRLLYLVINHAWQFRDAV